VRTWSLESAIYIVSTPIGNLSDITLRALEVLKSVDLIAAEDTRHTRHLLDHYGITTKMLSLHEHNENGRSISIVEKVKEGQAVALVSDAGTPLISDPGHALVGLAKKEGVRLVPIPGPSALITALCVSGIPCGKFIFEGFLPAKTKGKKDILLTYENERKAVIFYESPHRVIDTLKCMLAVFGNREVAVAREMTKRYETLHLGLLPDVLDWIEADVNQQKGEFVLIVSGAGVEKVEASDHERRVLLKRLLLEMSPKKASSVVSDVLGGGKKDIYNMALELQGKI